MVDVSSQNNSVSINVSTGGNSASITATPDMAQYYSEKSREWAISNRIVDNTDYSSKYYAEQSQLSAKEANNYERSVIEKYNSFIDVSNQAESEIQTLRDESISELSNAKNSGITDINNALNENLEEAKASIEENKTNAIEEIETLGNETLSDIKAQGIESRANLDLSNLSEVGEKHFLGKSQITNCITEIPQRIKLELVDGALTLKAGSEVIVPNGFESDGKTPKFDYVTIESDVTSAGFTGYTFTPPCFYAPSLNALVFDGEYTGTGTNGYQYDTTTNKLTYKGTTSQAGLENATLSYPIGLINMDATIGIKSIAQVFNGMGYLGSTWWLENLEGLGANGYNADGTYKNVQHKLNGIVFATIPSTVTASNVLGVFDTLNFIGATTFKEVNSIPTGLTASLLLNKIDNRIYEWDGNSYNIKPVSIFPACTFDVTNGVISNFQPKQPFRAVDYNDKPEISGWAMPSNKYIDLTLGASNTVYTAPANGWVWLQMQSAAAGQGVSLHSLPTPSAASSSACITSRVYSSATTQYLATNIPVRKGQSFVASYTASGTAGKYFRFCYAESEV